MYSQFVRLSIYMHFSTPKAQSLRNLLFSKYQMQNNILTFYHFFYKFRLSAFVYLGTNACKSHQQNDQSLIQMIITITLSIAAIIDTIQSPTQIPPVVRLPDSKDYKTISIMDSESNSNFPTNEHFIFL